MNWTNEYDSLLRKTAASVEFTGAKRPNKDIPRIAAFSTHVPPGSQRTGPCVPPPLCATSPRTPFTQVPPVQAMCPSRVRSSVHDGR